MGVQCAARSLQRGSDYDPQEVPLGDVVSGEWWIVGSATFDGNMVVESLSINSSASVLSLQQRVNELLDMSCTLVMPDGTSLSSCETCASVEEVGMQDGAILTAVLPINQAAIRNQLDFKAIVEDSLSRLEALIGDERRFGVLRRMLFNHLTTKKCSSTPVTDVVNQLRRNLGLSHLRQSELVANMRAEHTHYGTTYSMDETSFSSLLRSIAAVSVNELKTRVTLDSNRCAEAWLREELHRAGSGYRELQFCRYDSDCGYKKVAKDVRTRIWKHDASCQMIVKPASHCREGKLHYKMYLLDGSFEICGDYIYFSWQHEGFSCDVEEVTDVARTAQRIVVRRSTPWTLSCGTRATFSTQAPRVHRVAIEDCEVSDGPKDHSELQEVATALRELEINHYEY